MAEEPEVIRRQIEQTRSSLTEKLETLEAQVKETVEAVTSTVKSVKRAIDVERQVREHPLAMTGGALLFGVAAGYVLTARRGPALPRHWSAPPQAPAPERLTAGNGAARPGLLAGLLEPFGQEIDKLKATAIGMVFGAARDLLKDQLPPALAGNVEELIDGVTRKAGGAVIRGRVLTEPHEAPAPTETRLPAPSASEE
jgi:hypothetical protein